MWSSNLIFASTCFPRFSQSRFFRAQIFQGLGFSESRFFWVQVFQGPGPGSGSRFWKQPITQSYLSLLNSFLLLVSSTFSVFLKSLSDYFFSLLTYQSPLKIVSVNKLYCLMWSSNLFFASSCFPRFSWSRFFRVQVFLGPGLRSSRLINAPIIWNILGAGYTYIFIRHLNEDIIYYNFHFLLRKVIETYQVYYAILFIAFEFIFTLGNQW